VLTKILWEGTLWNLQPNRIRPATELDLASVDALLREWLDLRKQRNSVFPDVVRNAELIVAEEDGMVVGFIHYIMHNDIIDGGLNAFITAWYVSSSKRRRGIGSKLLRKAIEEAVGKGAVGIEASTTNPEARRLYETHGFKQFNGEVFLELDMSRATKW
jgi:ribosomal protein S18 acetylase RimI-like enzyme